MIEIEGRHIKRLDSRQLTKLLRRLLYLEAQENGIAHSAVNVSLELEVSDGGQDGRIKWEGGPEPAGWIPNRNTLFQCKATGMGPKKCKEEVLTEDGKVKPKVEEVLNAEGAYVLFVGRKSQDIEKAVEGIRKGLRTGGRTDSKTADVRVYDSDRISEWVNKFPSAVVSVMKFSGMTVPSGAKTWDQWQTYEENKYEYVCSETLGEYVKTLRQAVAEERAVVRIIGMAGLGKTRMALEAFRPPEDKWGLAVYAAAEST